MGIMDLLKKPKVQGPFTETTFECKRGDLTIRGTEYRPEGENLPVAIVATALWHGRIRCGSMPRNWLGWVIVPTASISAAAV